MDHLEENVIIDYVNGTTTTATRARIEKHLDACATCRELVAEAARAIGEEPSRMGTSVALADTAPEPGLPHVASDAMPTHPVLPDAPHSEDTVPEFDFDEESFGASKGMLRIGNRLAKRFLLKRGLGQGGMGVVYEAYDELLRVPVALKVISPAFSADPVYVRQLHKEILAARKIAHPNVCRVHDLGRADDLYFITMDLVVGDTLEQRIQGGDLTFSDQKKVALQLCAAVQAAHDVGIVHRDLKPANVMVRSDGHVFVMDFGLARDLSADASSLVGAVGTPGYWAPEQARGEAATVASDIYALGLTILELFAGGRFARAEALAKLPSAMRPIIARCTEVEPANRFSTAGAVRDAWLKVQTAPASRALTRATAASIVLAFCIVCLLLAWALMSRLRVRMEDSPTFVARHTPAAHALPPEDPYPSGQAPIPSLSPSAIPPRDAGLARPSVHPPHVSRPSPPARADAGTRREIPIVDEPIPVLD